MKNNVLIITLILCFYANLGISQERYKDAIFSEIDSETYTYIDSLQLDFYHANDDKATIKPLLLLVHGGGFSSGKRNNPVEKQFCVEMAKKGYAVASMSYRLTRKGTATGFGCDCPSEEKIKTFNASSEDVLSATKFLISKSKTLKINPKKIILVGSSAGAEAVLNTVYMKESNTTQDLTYGNIAYAGVISFAGAIVDIDDLNEKNAIPAFLFHGIKDNLVPYGQAAHHYCDEGTPGYLMLYGSKPIADKLSALGVSYILATDPEGNHDWANLAYGYTNEIANFIEEAILNNKKIQSNIQLSSKK
ncbi:alpha/beta hydrolase [Galbibacter sp. PAP.153]|uniref:alpha/beta hydrolase n=1 Tax=Galbibacter sp. PAP.153 TaxID=3104623 RepID=UPI003008BA10